MKELEEYQNIDQELDKLLQESMSKSESQDRDLALEAYATIKNKLGISSIPFKVKTAVRWTQRVAAILFVPALIGLFLAISINKSNSEIVWSEVSSNTGQTREVTLPDGSELTLNAGSRVTFPSKFGKKSRDVFFEGEVFADIAKNPEKPFIIHSKGINVKVFGTTFIFKSYDYANYAELLLLEGSVNMDIIRGDKTNTYSLAPGELVQYQKNTGAITKKFINVNTYKPFNDNRSIHFFNIPMEEIAHELENIFNTKIVIKNHELGSTRFLAFFTNNETLDEIINSFCTDNSIVATKSDGIIYLDLK